MVWQRLFVDGLASLDTATKTLKQHKAASDPILLFFSLGHWDLKITMFEKFTEALLSASTTGVKISGVSLTCSLLNHLDEDVMHRLCDAFAALPYLTDLRCHWEFPIKYVTRIMSRAKTIRHLEFSCCKFQATPEEVADFSRALNAHFSLTGLTLGSLCTLPAWALKALSSIPNLGALDLWNFDRYDGLVSAALGKLIVYSKLQCLKLPRLGFPISSVSTRLCQSRNIQDLSLSVCSPEDMQHLANIVKENETLTVLRIFICRDWHAPLLGFIKALKGNSTLSEVFIQTFMRSEANMSFSREDQDALVSMLETSNFTLRKLEIDESLIDCERTNASLQHLIKLNSLGWKNLLQDRRATKNDWVAKLVAAESDPSIIYSLLSKNPSALFDTSGHSRGTASPARLGAGQSALSDDKAAERGAPRKRGRMT